MKKIYLALVIALVTAILPVHIYAQTPQIKINNDNGEVAIDITSDFYAKSIDNIIPDIENCTEAKVESVKIKAEAKAEMKLRLALNSSSATDTNPLNAYKITVTDSNGTLVYNTVTATPLNVGDTYLDIPLGVLEAGDEKTYSVRYELSNSISDADVSIELAVKSPDTATPKPTSKPTATLKPKFDLNESDDIEGGIVFDFETEKDSKSDATATTKELVKVCGKDIPEGRFVVSGNGKLKITTKTGNVKSSYTIKEDANNTDSVKNAVVLLEKGDVITITPLDGDEKGRLKFDKVSTDALTSTATPKNPSDADKTNPKTGDNNLGIVIGVGVLAILVLAGLELVKRRKHN